MCPRCRSNDISPSRSWKLGDPFMALFRMRPFRCRQCQTRFYLPASLGDHIKQEREWMHEVQEREEKAPPD
jgi:hypothetical protein